MIEVTAIRAATMLLKLGGRTLLTDPWFGTRMWWVLPTWQKPGVALEDLPALDVVLATHLHPDHYEYDAVNRLWGLPTPPSRFVGPPGTRRFLPPRTEGDLHELGPGEVLEDGAVRITATRCVHTGPPPEEVNYVVEADGKTLFFGGDARHSDVFAEVGARWDVDVALLPVSGTEIFGHRTTMNEEDAYRAACDLGAKVVVPIHEGGVWMTVPPASRHPGRARTLERLARERKAPFEVVVLDPGQSAVLAA